MGWSRADCDRLHSSCFTLENFYFGTDQIRQHLSEQRVFSLTNYPAQCGRLQGLCMTWAVSVGGPFSFCSAYI